MLKVEMYKKKHFSFFLYSSELVGTNAFHVVEWVIILYPSQNKMAASANLYFD